MAQKPLIQFRVSKLLLAQLKKAAARHGLPLTEMTREVVREGLRVFDYWPPVETGEKEENSPA